MKPQDKTLIKDFIQCLALVVILCALLFRLPS